MYAAKREAHGAGLQVKSVASWFGGSQVHCFQLALSETSSVQRVFSCKIRTWESGKTSLGPGMLHHFLRGFVVDI